MIAPPVGSDAGHASDRAPPGHVIVAAASSLLGSPPAGRAFNRDAPLFTRAPKDPPGQRSQAIGARGVRWLVPVGSVERLTGEAGGDDAGEVGALKDVFVRAAQRVIDGLAGGLGLDDLVIELGELAPSDEPREPQESADQLGAAICVALASTIAAAGLTGTPSIDGFTDAFTVFTVVPAVAAVLSLRLVPSGTPQMTVGRST
jgi:hypothetical protein